MCVFVSLSLSLSLSLSKFEKIKPEKKIQKWIGVMWAFTPLLEGLWMAIQKKIQYKINIITIRDTLECTDMVMGGERDGRTWGQGGKCLRGKESNIH